MCVFLESCEVGSWHPSARKLSLDKNNGFGVGGMEADGGWRRAEESARGGPRRPEEPEEAE